MDGEALLGMDPHILVSLVNLKLRDFYSSLDCFCEDINVEKERLEEKLLKAGYEYKSNINQFK